MFHRMNRLYLQFTLKILSVLVLHLLLTHSCRGQSQLIGSSQPIVATVGDDIMLPCQLEPAKDVAALAVEWTRPDLDSVYVHVRRAGQDLPHVKHPSYKERTSLSIDGLKQGNISLKLSMVKLSDGGKYRCFILQLDKQSFVELVVGAVSLPVISLAGIDRVRGGAVLQCEYKSWHPQPDVFWLDGEGNLLSAGPTETVRGPDGLYTVSSRVTVEKRHSNNITCRVRQKNINQTRETHIIVPDDFFKVQSSCFPVIIGLAVGLVFCIVFIVAVFFFVWKLKQNKTKKRDETEGGRNKKLSKSGDPERQPLNAAGTDGATPTVTTAVSEENKGKKEKKNKHRPEASQHNDTNPAGKNSTEVFVEFDPNGKYLFLTNKSKEDLKLEGWKLRVKLNDKNPIMFTFEKSFTIRAEKNVTIWVSGCGFHHPPSDLLWEDLKRWEKGDKLLVELINCHEEIVTTTELEEKPEEEDQRKTDAEDVKNLEEEKQENNEREAPVFVKIDPNGNSLRLTNKSKEDLKLEGWKLRVKLNKMKPIMFTFEESIILRAGEYVNIWVPGFVTHPSPSNLVWKDLNRWDKGDKLLVELINCHGEIVKTTEV